MSVYLNPIANGILASALTIYLAFIPIMIHQYRKYGTLRMRGNLVIASFILYMITAWFMTILPLPSFEAVYSLEPIRPNFRPFLFIDTFLKDSGFILTKPRTWFTAVLSSSFFTVAFNFILTIPFGVYLRKYFKLSLPWVVASGFFLSLFYETTQYTGLYGIYPRAYRFADVDDLIVNTAGAVIGYFFAGCIDGFLPDPARDRRIITEKASVLRRLLSLLVDFIAANVLFELSRVVLYWNTMHREWDLGIFLVSEAIVFLLFPLLTKNRQTVGMLALKLHFQDKEGRRAKTSGILIHNLFVGILLYFFQLLFLIWLFVLVLKSLSQRKLCYYWEPWLDAYLKADMPPGKSE